MSTRSQSLGSTPVDLVAALGLAVGETVSIALIGLRSGRLHIGGSQAPEAGAPYLPVRSQDVVTLRVGPDPIWAWTTAEASLLSVTTLSPALGPLRGREVLDVASEDYERPAGFILQVGSSGAVTYRPVDGDSDVTENFSAAGVVSVGGIPLLLRAVRTGSNASPLVAGLV